MKSILLSDTKETLVGFRLAGINGKLITDKEDFLKIIDNYIIDEEIGIILVTQKLFADYNEELFKRKLKLKETILLKIPGYNEKLNTDSLTKHIQEAIGLKL